MSGEIYTVAEVNGMIQELLNGDRRFARIGVSGELSNYKIYPSGHHYFTIKDGEATLRAVMFRGEAAKLRYKPENGMKVTAFGRIAVYPRDGLYQLYAAELNPMGLGDLHVAFEQLKAKLDAEGLFDKRHKKPIPAYPNRIAVITSGAGAAVRDIIRVATARYPLARLLIMAVRVQGKEAPAEIVSALRYANRYRVADVIITGRGGGSIEDLWAFNDERVARAIYDSEIPVISAVGHEPDVTIADYVADLRAATPSNGAELAVPDRAELYQTILKARQRMLAAMNQRIGAERKRLRQLRERPVLQEPGVFFDGRRVELDRRTERLNSAVRAVLAKKQTRLAAGAAAMDAMSPLKVLARGYSIAEDAGGIVLSKKEQFFAGKRFSLRLSDGTVHCTAGGISDDGRKTGASV